MDSKYNYILTELALEDLDGILQYISEDLSNKQAAQNFGRKVFETIDTIREFPKSGMFVDNEFVSDKTVRKVQIDNYLLYYNVVDSQNMLYVLRIVYAKRNLDEILKNI